MREREQGAIAAIVAMLFGFGVLLSLAALTVDVGNINADRRQLQNGADAVALAVAQQCAGTNTCAPYDALTGKPVLSLQTLADANAADGATAIQRVDGAGPAICGTLPGLGACPGTPSMSNLQECPSAPASDARYVRVYTETKSSNGTNLLPYYFGAAITGINGANQQACATVTYGSPGASSAPIALSYCEWAAATGNDPKLPWDGTGSDPGKYASPPTADATPGYGLGQTAWPTPALQLPSPDVPGNEIIIGLQGTTADPSTPASGICHSWNGHDVPGGFGYLASASSCESVAAVNGWMKVDTGNTLPSGCPSFLPYFQKVLYLPVFDCTVKVTGSVPIPSSPPLPGDSCIGGAGNNTYYHIMGYAMFYLSGYTTSGTGASTDKNNVRTNYPKLSDENPRHPEPCSGNDRCLSGWFLKGLAKTLPTTTTTTPTGPSLGAYTITLSS